MDVADNCCGGKVVVTLEGGYHLTGLAESIKSVLIEMSDGTHVSDDVLARIEQEADSHIDPVIKRVIDQIKSDLASVLVVNFLVTAHKVKQSSHTHDAAGDYASLHSMQ